MSAMNRRTLLASGLATGAGALMSGPAFAAAQGYQVPDHHAPRLVDIRSQFQPYEIHVDPGQYALYWTLPNNEAIRYVVGIGREGRYTPGTFRVRRKAEWPSWTPTKAMIRREPEIYAKHAGGMPGGPGNPLGARALYLYKGNRDTYLRIHGTPNPRSIGTRVSNGCVRMVNSHVEQLYEYVPNGTRVVLH
ncbi:L,D-transpeptidase [Sulfitobacter sp. S190]|uniref:L,D-transpeptidase n=1 Tax=Sulfitobacter sp. S190 TaxID=2867022 RepID=UPI0021A8D921|nr:L,D-transpeptidase [Sulfitobacter sp. S190]UWR22215.1 L,D-transpeptidase [Sulfitobacter sp. S190]